jgi:hypothetical protein
MEFTLAGDVSVVFSGVGFSLEYTGGLAGLLTGFAMAGFITLCG